VPDKCAFADCQVQVPGPGPAQPAFLKPHCGSHNLLTAPSVASLCVGVPLALCALSGPRGEEMSAESCRPSSQRAVAVVATAVQVRYTLPLVAGAVLGDPLQVLLRSSVRHPVSCGTGRARSRRSRRGRPLSRRSRRRCRAPHLVGPRWFGGALPASEATTATSGLGTHRGVLCPRGAAAGIRRHCRLAALAAAPGVRARWRGWPALLPRRRL